MKSGFIALLGKPNVGKSTLLNRIIGEKVSIVSPKPQTTREKITGVLTYEGYQMIFVDTPGYHEPKTKLGEHMNRSIKSAVTGVDVIVILLDSTKRFTESDKDFILSQFKYNVPIYLLVNKIDESKFENVYPLLDNLSKFKQDNDKEGQIKEILAISAKKGTNIDKFLKMMEGEMADGNKYYDDDDYTDRTESFMISEIIREKALLFLQEEVPHGIGIQIQKIENAKKCYLIEADIVCEKDSHKLIIIGDSGEMIKLIGEKARIDIEKLIGRTVFLKLFVKVREDWRNKQSIMDDIGYNNIK